MVRDPVDLKQRAGRAAVRVSVSSVWYATAISCVECRVVERNE